MLSVTGSEGIGWWFLVSRFWSWWGGGGGQSFRSWASVSTTCEPGDVQLPLKAFWRSHSDASPSSQIQLTLTKIKQHARKHEGKGLSVQRILFFYYYYSFSLSFHYHPVGRRLSFCFGTHSLHTVGNHLIKKYFFIIGNYKTIITLCVTNVQRKKS